MDLSSHSDEYEAGISSRKQAYYHTCFLVLDLNQAIDLFSPVLNLEWHAPTVHQIEYMEDPKVHAQAVNASYSWEAPHIELLEASGNGIIRPELGQGLHHFGVWVENSHQHMISKNALGIRTEARILHKTDSDDLTTLIWFSDPESLGGIRFEFVDDMLRTNAEAWLANDTAHLDLA